MRRSLVLILFGVMLLLVMALSSLVGAQTSTAVPTPTNTPFAPVVTRPTDAATTTTTTTTTTNTGPTSTVDFFFVACQNQAVFDLSGVMQSGYDLYVQVFRETGATGTALTGVRQVQVGGDYRVSPLITFDSGAVLANGQFASARISIAREGNPSSTLYTTTVDDIFDGCVNPSFPATDTSLADGTGTTVTSTISGVFTPDGGVYVPPNNALRSTEPVVQIGARPSERSAIEGGGRSNKPGLVFAECDTIANTAPGRIFDTDSVTVFWSWFAETPALVREHVTTAIYEVSLESTYNGVQSFQRVDIGPVVRREDGNYWVFYTATLGDGFRPGDYRVFFRVRWDVIISDGYEEYGPGTATPFIESSCRFSVEPNPWGVQTHQNNPTLPLQSG